MSSPRSEEARIRATVRRIVTENLGSKPHRIKYESAGLSNFVYSVEHDDGSFIVRANPHPEKLSAFLKSHSATTRAAALGIPVPEILHVSGEPMPYMLLRKAGGEPGDSHPDRLRILHELGRYAALINSLRTVGFGSSFSYADGSSTIRSNWQEFLQSDIKLSERLTTLRARRMLSGEQITKVQRILEDACGRGRKPALNHGDLRLKNVIVNSKGDIAAILDWEDCLSSLAPEWELSVALHDLSIDEKHVFLEGYGLRPKDFAAVAPVIKALNVINYVGEVERLHKEKKRSELEFCRLRLSGALDLYCF